MTTSDGATTPLSAAPLEPLPAPRPAAPGWTWLSLLIGAAGLGCSVLLWQKVDGMQEQLARQTSDATTQATEARALARESQDVIREASAKLSLMEARINEMGMQREQLDTLVQNLTRTRDDTVVIDIETAVRMAQQQAQLTGSTEPLVAVLQSSLKRLDRAAQPRLIALQQAMERDLEQLTQSSVTDTSSLLVRLDDLVRLVDEMHVLNSPPIPDALRQPERKASATTPLDNDAEATSPTQWAWWRHWGQKIWLAARAEAGDLLRVSHITNPDAMLMAPEQAFFVRENLKLKLLNARLAVLARQYDAARADIATAQATLSKYFDPNARRTHQAQAVLTQLQANLQASKQPALGDTLSALSTAASGL